MKKTHSPAWTITTISIKTLFSLYLTLFVCGCDKINDLLAGEMVPPGLIMLKQDIQLQRLLLVADKDANKSRPFYFHIVLTKNLQMAKDLSQMTAAEYFKAHKAKKFDENYHGMYKIIPLTVTPGKKTPEKKIKTDSGNKYVGGYFFADLVRPKGSNRIRIPSAHQIMVKFTKDGMRLVTPDLMSEGIEALEDKVGIVPGI